MKYSYLVIRDEKREKGVFKYPVLGVHGSLKNALRHYHSVVENVTGQKVLNKNFKDIKSGLRLDIVDNRMVDVANFWHEPSETGVRLEKWIVKV